MLPSLVVICWKGTPTSKPSPQMLQDPPADENAGSMVGLLLGVGLLVGVLVGLGVGPLMGLLVGLAVGLVVGLRLGLEDCEVTEDPAVIVKHSGLASKSNK